MNFKDVKNVKINSQNIKHIFNKNIKIWDNSLTNLILNPKFETRPNEFTPYFWASSGIFDNVEKNFRINKNQYISYVEPNEYDKIFKPKSIYKIEIVSKRFKIGSGACNLTPKIQWGNVDEYVYFTTSEQDFIKSTAIINYNKFTNGRLKITTGGYSNIESILYIKEVNMYKIGSL